MRIGRLPGLLSSKCYVLCRRVQPLPWSLFRQVLFLLASSGSLQPVPVLCRGPLGNCVITGDFAVQALEDTLRAFCSK